MAVKSVACRGLCVDDVHRTRKMNDAGVQLGSLAKVAGQF